YDPNDKYAEPAGYEEPHFVLNDTQIEYRIRFQNTGNAPAETVVIEDQLDLNVLDMSTFNPLFASHDFTTSIDGSGKVIFTFDNIQLPDSTTDEPGSQGYVVYTISPIAGLTHGDEINNFAEIYFDLNPAIITNTYQHTIFECSSIDTSVPIGGYVACEGESFTSDYTQDYIESYSWEYDENLAENSTGSIDMEILESGIYPVLITLSNPLCTAEIETVATIATLPSNQLDFNNGELMAQEGVLYTWFLNGELIEGANDQSLMPAEPGEYTVVVTNMNGCSQVSEVIVVAPSVNESDEIDFLMFPNPATNEVVLDLPNGTWNIRILNSIGELLVDEQTVSNTLKVDLSALSAGLYHVSINNKEVKLIKKLVIQ
ncbi:MAG: T9SS type A sorting domain-containing protein, partial [Flavobacteriales bacterium]